MLLTAGDRRDMDSGRLTPCVINSAVRQIIPVVWSSAHKISPRTHFGNKHLVATDTWHVTAQANTTIQVPKRYYYAG